MNSNIINRLIAAAVALTIAASALGQEFPPRNAWMAALPNDAYVCSLTIPGTHDTFTYNCADDIIVDGWACSQYYTLKEQFEKGVRCFDLRPRYNSNVDGKLEIHHGPISCEVTFNEALKEVEKAVGGTRECAIVFVNREGGDADKGDQAIYEREMLMIDDPLYIQFRPDLTLGECRGRIIVFNRDDLSFCGSSLFGGFLDDYGSYGKKLEDGTIQKKVSYVGINGRASTNGTAVCKFYSQDEDSYFLQSDYYEKKIVPFTTTADGYFDDCDYFVWCSNQISAYCGTVVGMDYFQNAEMVHPWIRDYCKNTSRYHEPGKWRGLGICMMDYAGVRTHVEWTSHVIYGDELLDALINLNF